MNKEVSYYHGQMLRFQLRTSFVISETSTFDPDSTKLISSTYLHQMTVSYNSTYDRHFNRNGKSEISTVASSPDIS